MHCTDPNHIRHHAEIIRLDRLSTILLDEYDAIPLNENAPTSTPILDKLEIFSDSSFDNAIESIDCRMLSLCPTFALENDYTLQNIYLDNAPYLYDAIPNDAFLKLPFDFDTNSYLTANL